MRGGSAGGLDVTGNASSVAVAIPAYNEADGVGGFLRELDESLSAGWSFVTMIVVDDASCDGTPEVIEKVASTLRAEVKVVRSPVNRGHGPTVLEAYHEALASGADYVLQVDGDGQFHGDDIAALSEAVDAGAVIGSGIRMARSDPWFRRATSRTVRVYLRLAFGVALRDPNCPFRLYERHVLAELLRDVPPAALIPNVYLSALAQRAGLALAEVPVKHRVRRGDPMEGSTWGPRRVRLLPPVRLLKLLWAAFRESLAVRRSCRAARVRGAATM
jgi:glycosyltransferase involved in cell wall biosynthesis